MRPAILLTALLLGAAAVHAANPARKLAQAVKPSIVNGKESSRVGWFVSLGARQEDGTWFNICGGMLITQTVVLTAAHCVVNSRGVRDVPWTVAIGIHNLETDKPGIDYEEAFVLGAVVHPRFAIPFYAEGYDIALIVLDPDSVSGKNELVALPTYVPKPSNPVPDNTRLELIGFGNLGNDTYPNELQRTTLVLEPLETCNQAWAGVPHLTNFLESTGICGGAPRVNRFTDACDGDSGGPLYAPRTAGRPYDTAIGLVSYGVTCGGLFNKTEYGPPGVYTNIAQLKRWITANLACLDEGSPCPWGGTCFDNPAQGCSTCQPDNPTACGNCTVPGFVPNSDGECRPKDCVAEIENCIECAPPRRHQRHGQPQLECAACFFGYKVENNKCVPKTCHDWDRACAQCNMTNPIMCTACKRHHVQDTNTGKCVPLPHV